uniref:Uncharacterized protein n=1 Tax=Knipowitschia caucasica TaxID=637954 RepID=A0AAV2LVN5_KNICA
MSQIPYPLCTARRRIIETHGLTRGRAAEQRTSPGGHGPAQRTHTGDVTAARRTENTHAWYGERGQENPSPAVVTARAEEGEHSRRGQGGSGTENTHSVVTARADRRTLTGWSRRSRGTA